MKPTHHPHSPSHCHHTHSAASPATAPPPPTETLMDYERILKPSSQGGGFSPGKLRAMLLGVEKRRGEESSEVDSRSSLRSESSGVVGEDECRDVGVVVVPDRSAPPSGGTPESSISSSGFEFQKARSALVPPFSKPAPSKWDDAQKWILSPVAARGSKPGGGPQKKCGNRQVVGKVVSEVTDEADTKQVDSYPVLEKCEKSTFLEISVSDPAIRLSQHDSSTSHPMAFIAPPSTARAVSMRDMGTEMTPIVSQEPSRTETPVRATTPSRSPTSSRPSSPPRSATGLGAGESIGYRGYRGDRDGELSEKELQRKTRREIMLLGTQLGKANIAAWASKEEEEKDASVTLKRAKSIVESRAVAWEEAEKAKYMARFKEEEVKIEAWENHQKAKAEAGLREIEVTVERMKSCAQDRLVNKLAAIRNKAEEKRAAVEAKRNQQAARTAHQADYIRQTGRIPSLFTCCCWRWCRCPCGI